MSVPNYPEIFSTWRKGIHWNCNMENGEEKKNSPSSSFRRERSNSDPGVREPKIIMNGTTTVPTRKAPSVFASVEVEAQQVVNTPPPTRKNKFASSISKFFRPWKWRRKKKSDKFLATSQSKCSFCQLELFDVFLI